MYHGKEEKNLNNIENKFSRKYVTNFVISFFRLFDYFFRSKTPIFPKIFFQNLEKTNLNLSSSKIGIKKKTRTTRSLNFRTSFWLKFPKSSSKIRGKCWKSWRKNLITFHDAGQRQTIRLFDRETMFDKRLKQWTENSLSLAVAHRDELIHTWQTI